MRKVDNLPPSCAVVTKSGNLNFLGPFGPVQACNGTALPFNHYGNCWSDNERDGWTLDLRCLFSFLLFRNQPLLVSWTRVWPLSISTLFHNGGKATTKSLYTHGEPMKPT